MPDSLAPDVAEQLLDLREPDGGSHAEIAALLVAAAGPALPAELAGEDTALRGFRQAYRARRRRRAGLFASVAVAALSLGGTAYAAGGDHLPGPVQRTVESLFGARDTGIATPSAAPGTRGTPGASTTPPGGVPAPPGGVPAVRAEQLCRAWEAARTDPHAPQVTGEDRRELARAAKSAAGIDAFCRGVLAAPSPTTSAGDPTTASNIPTTAKPGNTGPGSGASPGTGGGADRTHPAKPSHR
jgi:hypothetical protein